MEEYAPFLLQFKYPRLPPYSDSPGDTTGEKATFAGEASLNATNDNHSHYT